MPYCQKCGKEVRKEDSFCPSCGQALSVSPVQRTALKATRSPKRVSQRPVGVTILAILEVLGGLIFFTPGISQA